MKAICRECPSTTPIVSRRAARLTVEPIPEKDQLRARSLALAWILVNDPGLHVYEGISGRGYTLEERVAVSNEARVARKLACPFHVGGSCFLGGVETEVGRAPDYLFLPTAVLKLLDARMLHEITRAREVADAKVAVLTRNEGFD